MFTERLLFAMICIYTYHKAVWSFFRLHQNRPEDNRKIH